MPPRPARRPDPTRSTTPSPPRSATLPWAIAAIAVLVAVAAVLVPRFTGRDSAADATSGKAGEPSAVKTVNPEYGDTRAFERREADDPTALGRTDAPVVMIAYSDFQCPYCGKFARSTEKDLITKYVDSGTLRIEWRDFPYLGEESVAAARAARAAAAQDKFWPFHDALYAEQLPPNSGKLTPEFLTALAEKTGLDTARFKEDMSSATTAKLVQHDFDEGMSSGVTGTPSFLVNGVPIIGAMPLADFENTIERAAKDAGSS